MSCQCHSLDDAFFIENAPNGFQEALHQLDMADWRRLFECSDCGTLWAIDEWDKYHDQVASRVKDRKGWSSEDSELKRKELLRRSRGGEEGGECIWAECHKPRIRGVVYCLEHLYKTGARK